MHHLVDGSWDSCWKRKGNFDEEDVALVVSQLLGQGSQWTSKERWPDSCTQASIHSEVRGHFPSQLLVSVLFIKQYEMAQWAKELTSLD